MMHGERAVRHERLVVWQWPRPVCHRLLRRVLRLVVCAAMCGRHAICTVCRVGERFPSRRGTGGGCMAVHWSLRARGLLHARRTVLTRAGRAGVDVQWLHRPGVEVVSNGEQAYRSMLCMFDAMSERAVSSMLDSMVDERGKN